VVRRSIFSRWELFFFFFFQACIPGCAGGALIVDIGTPFFFLFFGSVLFFLMGQGGVGLEGVGGWWRF